MNQIISEIYIRECINEARFYESCADADRAQAVLSPVMDKIAAVPNSDDIDTALISEALLVYGSVISYQGLTKKEKYLQESAMNFLTEARKLASEINDRALVGEAEKQMGLCYWRLGQHENALAYFDTVLERYTCDEQKTNPICLSTQINVIGVNFDLQNTKAAKKLFEKIKPFVDASDDGSLQTRFYTEAAGIYLKLVDFHSAIPFLEKAIKLARLTKNDALLANALNNLALVYLTTGYKTKARDYIEKAIEVFSGLQQMFTLGMALETKTQILISMGDYQAARETIDKSIRILERSENYVPLAESLWTRIVIKVAQTNDKASVIIDFNNLINLTRSHLSENCVNCYIEKFTHLFYIETGRTYYEKTENYRRFSIEKALATGDGSVNGTAAALGISHQNTSLLLKKYPDLCEKYGVKLRTRATDSLRRSKNTTKKIAAELGN